MTAARASRPAAGRAVVGALAAVVLAGTTACAPASPGPETETPAPHHTTPPEDRIREEQPVHEMTTDQPRAELDAVLAEVRVIVEDTLGTDGWRQDETSGGVTSCGSGTWEYTAPHMLTTTVMDAAQWSSAWPRIRETVERHGYTDGAEIPLDGRTDHLLEIRNERGDRVRISNIDRGGFTYGGRTGCYPKGTVTHVQQAAEPAP